MLSFDELASLQDKFENYPAGMKIQQFVASMLSILSIEEREEQVKITVRLKELFAQVDVNGDGSMEWEEFSSFCISNGIKKTHKDKLDQTYTYRADLLDQYSHGGFFQRLRYLPEISKIVACEGGKLSLKIYEVDAATKALQVLHEQLTQPGKGTSGAAVDAAYAHCHKLLICSHDDMNFRVYDLSCYSLERTRAPTQPVLVKTVKVESNQITLCWDTRTRRLFSSGIDGVVHIWNLTVQVATIELVHAGTLKQVHTDIIKDMMSLPHNGVLVTAGMDSRICLWDTTSDTLKSTRTKHTQGVHSLASIGDGYALSAGYDSDIYCWNFDSTSYEPYFALSRTAGGHQHPVLSVVACARSKMAFSIDMNGSLRWWDVRLDSTILDQERCLQIFGIRDLSGKTTSFRPSALGIWPAQGEPAAAGIGGGGGGGGSGSGSGGGGGRMGEARPAADQVGFPVVIATDAKLHVFSAVPKHPEVACVTSVQYNSTTLSLFVAYGNDVQIWDADTGAMLRQLHDVAPSIGNICLDNRERKFIVGSGKGDVTVHDCETGSLLKRGRSHRGEIVAIECV